MPSVDDTAKASQSTSLVKGSQKPGFAASSSPLPGFYVTAQASPLTDEMILDSRFDVGETRSAEASPLAPVRQAEKDDESRLPNGTAETARPAGAADSDFDLIDSLRGIVNIID